MKVRFLATGVAPDEYKFDGEKIYFDGEWYDLSEFDEGDIFAGINGGMQGIREVKRINGELHVTLCQKAPLGHWTGKEDYIDSSEYDSDAMYIRQKTEAEIRDGATWAM